MEHLDCHSWSIKGWILQEWAVPFGNVLACFDADLHNRYASGQSTGLLQAYLTQQKLN
jgi:hypothetical protein